MEDIRWIQRFENFRKALRKFNLGVKQSAKEGLNELEAQGLIQSFEFTHELAWKVIKDYFFDQGNSEIRGSRDATREAFKTGIITNGESWMEMIVSRNKSSHTYDEETAKEIVESIVNIYSLEFNQFEKKMRNIARKDHGDLFKET